MGRSDGCFSRFFVLARARAARPAGFGHASWARAGNTAVAYKKPIHIEPFVMAPRLSSLQQACPKFLWVRAHEADQFGQGVPKVTESVNRFSHAVPIAFKRVPIVDAKPLNSKSWWENWFRSETTRRNQEVDFRFLIWVSAPRATHNRRWVPVVAPTCQIIGTKDILRPLVSRQGENLLQHVGFHGSERRRFSL